MDGGGGNRKESALAIILLVAVGVIVVFGRLFVGAAIGYNVIDVVEKVLLPLNTQVLCAVDGNGIPYLSLPTGRELCLNFTKSDYPNSIRIEEKACAAYVDEKKAEACGNIVDTASSRLLDCAAYYFTNKTEYTDGAPEVIGYCAVLRETKE